MKVVIKVKQLCGNEIEMLSTRLLKVPIVYRCELIYKEKDRFKMQVEMEDGYEFYIHAYVTENGYPAQISEFADKIKKIDGKIYPVIIAPYISEMTSKICEEKKVGFVDYVGNCLLQVHSLYISEKGHKNKQLQKRGQKSIFERSSTVSSMILRILFQDLNKSWKLKYLSEEAGCSIGQVSKVKDFLCKNLWAEMTLDGLKITKAEEVLSAWQKVYRLKESRKYTCYTLDVLPEFERKLADMKQKNAIDYYLTGFSGGVRYAPVVRYNKVHVYMNQEDISEAMKILECRPVETGANVIIYVLEDECYRHGSQIRDGVSVVSPVQIYLDCMQIKGRGEEMAEAIRNKEILI